MVKCIAVYNKESESRATDSKHSTADFEEDVNITMDSSSVIPQGESDNEEDCYRIQDSL